MPGNLGSRKEAPFTVINEGDGSAAGCQAGLQTGRGFGKRVGYSRAVGRFNRAGLKGGSNFFLYCQTMENDNNDNIANFSQCSEMRFSDSPTL